MLIPILLLWLTACSSPTMPTRIPAAQLPQPSPTSNLPPTQDINAPTPAVANTAVPITPKPTRTPTPVDPVINVSAPHANEILILGEEVAARGLVNKEEEQQIIISLVTSNGRTLTQTPGIVTEIGWEAAFTLPPNVTGQAFLKATLLDQAGNSLAEHQSPVLLTHNPDTTDRYLDLNRPDIGDTAVGGYNIFFDGTVFRPVNSSVIISIWADNCQEQIAQQSFRLGSSSRPIYWQGFVVVPQDLVGPACAVAHFGEPGTEEWREAQIPIEVLAQDDAAAQGVTIGNPPPEGEFFAGQEMTLYGTAYNVTEGPVTISVLMDNGRIAASATTETDYWGYWEVTITLPIDAIGQAEITVTAGDEDESGESQTIVTINPAPTPTPIP
ncbi:MAG: hypothetical protein GY796_12505 [Chloroflexi bacterium]|nr:hypothetical protein [Chloroflexota bacterium]